MTYVFRYLFLFSARRVIAVLVVGFASLLIQAQVRPPTYRVDPTWPKELPNNWIIGQVGGLAVDSHNNIWIHQRPRSCTPDELGATQTPPRSMCCVAAPSVIEFDQNGKLLQAWGGPGHVKDWFENEHGIRVDSAGNVWLTGNGDSDRHVMKFTNTGKLLLEIGHPSKEPENNQDTSILGRPAGVDLDEAAHEVYIADGYMNKRIVVYDSETGKFKRGWGAYGIPLSQIDNTFPVPAYKSSDPHDKQFRNPTHCVHLSRDNFVYVCDRQNDRVQVFQKDGKFVKEFFLRPETLGSGSDWDMAFSADKEQTYLLIADGTNNVIWTVKRSDGTIIGSTGHSGRNAGQFHWVHQIGSDSMGNLYTGEVDTGKRVQKFKPVQHKD
jgi:DNA-binding beta-propeller fold protein YncE